MAIVLAMDEERRPHAHTVSRWFPSPVLLPGIVLGLGNVTYAAMAGFLILLLRESRPWHDVGVLGVCGGGAVRTRGVWRIPGSHGTAAQLVRGVCVPGGGVGHDRGEP